LFCVFNIYFLSQINSNLHDRVKGFRNISHMITRELYKLGIIGTIHDATNNMIKRTKDDWEHYTNRMYIEQIKAMLAFRNRQWSLYEFRIYSNRISMLYNCLLRAHLYLANKCSLIHDALMNVLIKCYVIIYITLRLIKSSNNQERFVSLSTLTASQITRPPLLIVVFLATHLFSRR
jgi:hypothetical protein